MRRRLLLNNGFNNDNDFEMGNVLMNFITILRMAMIFPITIGDDDTHGHNNNNMKWSSLYSKTQRPRL